MITTVRKIGNSLGNIIPAIVAKDLGIEKGDKLRIGLENGHITLEKVMEKPVEEEKGTSEVD